MIGKTCGEIAFDLHNSFSDAGALENQEAA
jgi:hypothetical protein